MESGAQHCDKVVFCRAALVWLDDAEEIRIHHVEAEIPQWEILAVI